MNKLRNSEQQAKLFAAIMQEAEEETGMFIAVSENGKIYIVDSVTAEKYELETVCCQHTNKHKNKSKKSRKYVSSKNKQKAR